MIMYISRRALQILILTVFGSNFALAIVPSISDVGSGNLATNTQPLGGKYPRYKVGKSNVVVAPDENAGVTIGVRFRPRRDSRIIPQAVGGILVQALYEVYNEYGSQPLVHQNRFSHSERATEPSFDVGVTLAALPNVTDGYRMTNGRMVKVLSLLGFDFSQQTDTDNLYEYDFDVIIDRWQLPEILIATGSLENNRNSSLPIYH